ncbi:MAG: hypothetical protein EXX96DRAFT_553512 [Benjaminiella poitrasii]|nr:MAG: hypothetical protein EXX96DRAFT_553512 [Benjaminiella poitrasii]
MWTETIRTNTADNNKEKDLFLSSHGTPFEKYIEDDDTVTTSDEINSTGRTSSTITISNDNKHKQQQQTDTEYVCINEPPALLSSFEKPFFNDVRVTHYRNTYFMDGGSRFISLPTLGNTNTKAASHISRIFEDWLQNKLYNQASLNINETLQMNGEDDDEDQLFLEKQHLPILEDSVELLAEDIVNKLKSRNSVRGLTGLSRVYVKIRTGHVYTYHQLEDGQPLITADMEDFFQQFPLFVEIIIFVTPKDYSSASLLGSANDMMDDVVQLLLTVENITTNPSDPYYIKEDIPLAV